MEGTALFVCRLCRGSEAVADAPGGVSNSEPGWHGQLVCPCFPVDHARLSVGRPARATSPPASSPRRRSGWWSAEGGPTAARGRPAARRRGAAGRRRRPSRPGPGPSHNAGGCAQQLEREVVDLLFLRPLCDPLVNHGELFVHLIGLARQLGFAMLEAVKLHLVLQSE